MNIEYINRILEENDFVYNRLTMDIAQVKYMRLCIGYEWYMGLYLDHELEILSMLASNPDTIM